MAARQSDPLELKEFYEEIDSREGFCQEVIGRDSLCSLEQQMTDDRHQTGKAKTTEVFVEATDNVLETDLEQDRSDYDDNRRSESVRRIEARLVKIRELLTTRNVGALETLTTEQASLVRSASHYWLDTKDGRLYKKNVGNNSMQLVIEEGERMRLLKACYDDMGHRGAYATGKLLQQRFWWPKIEEDVIWYVKLCHLCQIRQRRTLERSPVVTHTPSIFQILHADTVHMNPPSNGCKYIVHGRCGLSLS